VEDVVEFMGIGMMCRDHFVDGGEVVDFFPILFATMCQACACECGICSAEESLENTEFIVLSEVACSPSDKH
jgi:hypothetical protein